MTRSILFRLLLVLVLAWVGYVLSVNLEKETRVVNQGPSLEVGRNTFFAAGAFLQQRGLNVEHHRYPVNPDILEPGNTLLLSDTSYLADDPERVERLLSWVRAGGRLIWAYPGESDPGPLALALGIGHERDQPDEQNKQTRKNKARDNAVESEAAASETVAGEQDLETLGADEPGPRARVRIGIRQQEALLESTRLSRLESPQGDMLRSYHFGSLSLRQDLANSDGEFQPRLEAASRSADGVEMLLLRLGTGRITVLRDISIWSNDRIGLFDHAHLLGELTRGSETVHIQRYSQWPPLSRLIWEHAPEALLAGVCLLLGWLLYHGRRFGPVLQPNLQRRRTLREHIEAVARFHHEQGQTDHLLAPLRQQVMKRAARLDVGFDRLSPEQQQRAVAQQSDVPQEQIARALTPQGHYTSAELVETVQLLIRIRNRL